MPVPGTILSRNLAATGAVRATGQELQPMIGVGSRKQLFMDERLIETNRGVQLDQSALHHR